MPVDVKQLRDLGTRRVTLRTKLGDFTGQIAQVSIADSALMVMFASERSPADPLVVALHDIEAIEER